MVSNLYKIGLALIVIALIISILSYVIALVRLWVARFESYLLKKENIQIYFEGRLYKKLCKSILKKNKKISSVSIIIKKLVTYLTSIGSMILGIDLSYTLIKLIITVISYQLGPNEKLVEYLTLTLTLTLLSYFPDKLTFWFSRSISKLINKGWSNYITMSFEQELGKSEKLILILQPKLWMYFISIVFTLLNSLEVISGTSFIEIKAWIEIKPIIFESVFTMLIIDSFVAQAKSDKDKIIKYIKDYKD